MNPFTPETIQNSAFLIQHFDVDGGCTSTKFVWTVGSPPTDIARSRLQTWEPMPLQSDATCRTVSQKMVSSKSFGLFGVIFGTLHVRLPDLDGYSQRPTSTDEQANLAGSPQNGVDQTPDAAPQRMAAGRTARQKKMITALEATAYSDLQEFLDDLTRLTSETAGVVRVSIWFFDEACGIVCRSMFDARWQDHTAPVNRAHEGSNSYLAALKTARPVIVNDAENDPVTEALPREILRSLGITSILDFPILIHGKVSARLSFAHVGPPRYWDDIDFGFASELANMIAKRMLRSRELDRQSDSRVPSLELMACSNLPTLESSGKFPNFPPRENELDMGQIADSLGNFCWISDLENNKILDVSSGYEEIFGRPRDELFESRNAWVEALHPEDRDRVLKAVQASRTSGKYKETYRVVRPDGSVRWLFATGTPVLDASGRLCRMVGIAIDITRQKTVQDALLATEVDLHEIQRFARLASWQMDLSSRTIKWSEDLYRILELNPEHVQPSARAFLARVHPDERAIVERQFTVLREEATEYEAIHRLVFENGRTKFVQFRASMARALRGRPEKLLGIIQDITELHLAEIERNRSQRLEALGQLAGGIAHDLNNALTPIVMATSLLKTKLPAYHKPLATMERSAQRCAEMVKRLVLFARGEESKRVVLSPVFSMDEMVKICRGTFPAGIEILRSSNATRSKIIADPTQIHQILLNLCVNARDAMPHGGRLELSISSAQVDGQASRLLPQARPGRYVIFSVRDSGCGMSQEVMDHIFEPFYTTKGPERGTGLGLSTAFRIVRAHGGFIQVKSAPGKGSEFLVYLPATDDPIPDVPPASPQAEAPPMEAGRMILVVEDEEAIRKAFVQELVQAGYQALEAKNGIEGLIQVVKHKHAIDLIVSDFQMPKMNGSDFVKALRTILPHVPVIIACGNPDDATRQSLQSLGILKFFAKPFDPECVFEMVRSALAHRS